MKPVYQTRFGKPQGNCWAACVASILEVPLSEVDFDTTHNWVERADAVLRRLGWYAVEVQLRTEEHHMPLGVPYIAAGKNAAGVEHAVVYRDGKIVHDPHPAGAGLQKLESLIFLIPLHPGRMRRIGTDWLDDQELEIWLVHADNNIHALEANELSAGGCRHSGEEASICANCRERIFVLTLLPIVKAIREGRPLADGDGP